MSYTNKKSIDLFKLVFLFLLTLAVAPLSFAQQSAADVREDFSKDELESFADAYKEVAAIQEESKQNMVGAIENEGLSVDRFNEMLSQQQNPEQEVDASAEEMASFNNAAQAILAERKESEQKVVSTIEDKGLELETYRDIMLAYQYSPKVQRKLDKLLRND